MDKVATRSLRNSLADVWGRLAGRVDAPQKAVTHLHGRRLLAARLTWGTVAALSLGLFLAGVIAEIAQTRALCPTPACDSALRTPGGLQELERLGIPPSLFATYVRSLHSLGLTLGTYIGYTIVLDVVFALVYVAVAGLIFWRRSHDRVGLMASLALLTFGTATYANVMATTAVEHPAWRIPVAFLQALGSATIVIFLFVFPDGRFVPRWTRWVALLWVLLQIPQYFFPRSSLAWGTWPALLQLSVWALIFGVIVWARLHSYRRVASPEQKLQTKWVVHGVSVALIVYLGLGAALAVIAPPSAAPSPGTLATVLVALTIATLALLLIPVSIAIAILRHHLFDIDLIISRTLVYGSLTGILALVYQTTLVSLQTLFLVLTGQGSFLANVLSTVVIGALFEPLRRRLHAFFDHHLAPKVGFGMP